MILELEGLAIFGRHGVLEEERRDGQEFLYDIRMDVGDAGVSDRIEDAVDYREVVEVVRSVSAERQFQLLESMAGAVAAALLERFPLQRARVRVRKPQVQLGVPVEYSAATAERSRA